MKITELKQVARNKIGRVNLNNAHLEAHEYETILFLNLYGFDIEVIKPHNIPKTHNPDFLIGGAVWETKSPEGSGNSTVSCQFHNAGRQSDRLILLITKDKKLLDIKR
ncbi:MAG: hypothetical protein Q4A25_02420 [Candidatus Saccharibacteria bacterium]|nr:hypothetical protein [Candidatus Saccharibacteria bacterium]